MWPAWQQVPQLRRGLLEFFARHSDVPEELIAQVNREAETIRHSDYIRTLASVYRGMDLRSYAHVRTPVLAVSGQTEHPVAHEAVLDLVRASPTTVGISPRGVGHNWYIEDPQAFAETVRLWCHEQQIPDPSVRVR